MDIGTTTGSGTTTSFGTTPGRTTPYVTSSGTPSWTTTQHVQTTQVEHETTHYRNPSTPHVEHEVEENELDHDHEHEENENEDHEHGRTQVLYTDLPVPEAEPEAPFYPHVPPPSYNPGQRPKGKNNGRISSETEERAAMIIGIVAGALIAVILVIFLLVWLRKTGDRQYKNDRIVYGQGPNAALLGSHSNTGTNGSRHHATNGSNVQTFNNNGSMRNGSTDKGPMPGLVPQKPKKRDSKDIKEWYV